MEYKGKKIPFPVLRLGNIEKVKESIEYIKELYNRVKKTPVFEGTLDRRKDERSLRAKQLSNLLKQYEEVLELKDRKEAIKYAIQNGLEGDIIMLIGKGHEDYKEIKGVRYPFDERLVIKEILEEIKK